MKYPQDQQTFLEEASQYLTIPIIKKMYVDSITPVDLFQNLQKEAIYLLESNESSSEWSNYSFIGLQPFLTIHEQDGMYELQDQKGDCFYKGDTFKETFQTAQNLLKVKVPNIDLPFKGGAVGFLGYDAVSLLEKVPSHSYNDLGMSRCHFAFCETILAYHHEKKEVIIVHYIRLDGSETEEEKERLYESAQQKIKAYFHGALRKNDEQPLMFEQDLTPVSFDDVESTYEKEKFLQDVENIKEYIRSGDVFQAVLSQRFKIPVSISGFDIYRVLRLVNPSPYLFYLNMNGIELIGSSPERLIQIHDGHLEIHPIAGTRRRGRTYEEDQQLGEELLADEKERAEHYMLVDLARNDIGRVAEYGSVNTPVLMELVNFSHVMHLISKVTGRLAENVHPIDALLAAFPAGTVSGAPKVRAMQILAELEPTARNVYAGTVAYLDFDGNIDSCIAIRTILLKDCNAYVQAGAGIVADSVPELEYKETKNKASALIKTIQLAEKIYQKEGNLYV